MTTITDAPWRTATWNRGPDYTGPQYPWTAIPRMSLYQLERWSDCGHNSWRRGVVLDPFAGTATTLQVAEGHGHDSIGIDLDVRNADLAHERLGMFLEVVA